MEGFEEYNSDFLTDYVKALGQQMPGGANIVGAISARMKLMYQMAGQGQMADMLTYAPGDRTVDFMGDDNATKVGLGVPIGYDIWYIYPAGNVLEFGGKSIEDSMEKMEPFFDSLDDAKPMRSPQGGAANANIAAEGFEYTIKEARFETWIKGNGPTASSVGPKEGDTNDMAGYIAVPIGPLGVMWRVSLASESSLSEGTGSNVFPASGDNHTIMGGEILPPFDTNMRETCGEMMMNKGYLIDDDTTCELWADGPDDPQYHKWLRYWIKNENTTIIPGEFIGILCRPWPLHCWWKQETAPFVYAGNWIETEFYAAGVVKEVFTEDDYDEDGEVGNRYKVWVKNEELLVKSSDFLEYEVDERVGILKTYRDGEGGPSYGGSMTPAGDGGGTTNFTEKELELQNTETELNREWIVVPVDFFSTGGTSVGGA